MNNKKILIVDEEQNDVLVGELKKLLSDVGIGAHMLDLRSRFHNRLLCRAKLPPLYGLALVLYSHSDDEIAQDVCILARRHRTLLAHGLLIGRLGVSSVGALCLPKSSPRLDSQRFLIEADAGSVWRVKLLNRLRDSGFEIDKQRFMHYAKRL